MIIKANLTDINELVKLRYIQQKDDWEELFIDNKDFNEKTKNYLLQHLNKDLYIFLYKEDTKILSTCAIQVIEYLPQYFGNGKVGYLCNAYTQKDYRNKGLQTMLIKYIIDFALHNEIYELELSVNNIKAKNLYKKIGFQEDLWRMRLEIKEK